VSRDLLLISFIRQMSLLTHINLLIIFKYSQEIIQI